ncbi:MAG: RNA-binding S4 domain-containing protein [Verrucomicrobiales bacterium]|nr:RNA-binding S4 domain-containing protein [Verrucomicrobiales bacterium]
MPSRADSEARSETPPPPGATRVDKWLWAVRLFKTRSLAAQACRCGQVRIDEHPVKASRDVRPGDVLQVRTGPVTRTVRVRAILEDRIGAAKVPAFLEDLTPPEELRRLKEASMNPAWRPPGAGRPTKRERRLLEAFLQPPPADD